MKHVAVAVDIGPSSDRAFERAVMLAATHKARLTLIHVIDDQLLAYADKGGRFEAEMIGRAEECLKRYGASLPRAVARNFRQDISIGRPWERILKIANDGRADLIVLGLHRASPIRDVFVGTTAERLIRLGTLPVLTVRDKPEGQYRKVLVGMDFSVACSHALSAALDLAPTARFTVLHVFETPFPAFVHFTEEDVGDLQADLTAKARKQTESDLRRYLQSHLGSKKPAVQLVVQSSEVAGGLASVVNSQKPDLLVLGTHGRPQILGAMLGSTAGAFLNDPPCDVLVSR